MAEKSEKGQAVEAVADRESSSPQPITPRVATATLPGGRVVKMRELTGRDEINTLTEIDKREEGDLKNLVGNWAMLMRSTVELDGKPFDQSLYTAESFRNLFTPAQWLCLVELGQQVNGVTEEELATFRGGITWGLA